MTPPSKHSTAELMRARTEKAKAEIRTALWDGLHADDVCDLAFRDGVSPDEVQAIETEVTASKAAIHELHQYDLAVLKSTADQTAAQALKLQEKSEAAHHAFKDAADKNHYAQGALMEAKTAFDAIATRCESGELPLFAMPDQVKAIVESREVETVILKMESEINALDYEIAVTDERRRAIQDQAGELKNSKSDERIRRGERIVLLADDCQASANTMAEQIKRGRLRIKNLAADVKVLKEKSVEIRRRMPW